MAFLRDKNIYVLLITALLAHGLLLLNDGVYWDGWLIFRYLKDQNYDAMYQTYKMLGTWGISNLFWSLHYFDDFIFVHKFVVFCCICVANISVYLIAKRLNSLSDLECLLVGMLSIVYSSYQLWHELIMFAATIFYAIFYVAIYLLMISCDTHSYIKRFLIKTFAMVLFFTSFLLPSLLVYYYAAMIVYYVKDGNDKPSGWKRFIGFVKSNVFFLILPIVYWVAKVRFFSPSKYYSGYNGIRLDPAKWIFNIAVTLRNSVNAQLSECIKNLIEYPLLIVVVGLVVCTLQARIIASNEKPMRAISSKWMLVFGIVALILSFFAYAAVDRYATTHGWSTRHSLLMYVPISVIIVALTKIGWGNHFLSGSRTPIFFVLMLIAGFVVTNNKVYMQYQLRWVKDKAFVYLLRNQESLKKYNMYLVYDNMNVGVEESYNGYEYSSMFKEAWGGESRYGIDMQHYDNRNGSDRIQNEIDRVNEYIMALSPIAKSMFIVGDYQPENKIVSIYLFKKTRDPNLLIYLKYYYYKFVRPEQMNGFLDSIISIRSDPPIESLKIKNTDERAS